MTPRVLGPLAVSAGVLVGGQWLLADVMHLPGGGLSVLAAGVGIWWLAKPPKRPSFREPVSLQGWVKRCEEVLHQFAELESALGLTALRAPMILVMVYPVWAYVCFRHHIR